MRPRWSFSWHHVMCAALAGGFRSCTCVSTNKRLGRCGPLANHRPCRTPAARRLAPLAECQDCGLSICCGPFQRNFYSRVRRSICGHGQKAFTLQRLALGDGFNQSITNVLWPASLQQLSFGWKFNQPVAGVAWPASLQHLSFGWEFNHPIAKVVWPASLAAIVRAFV